VLAAARPMTAQNPDKSSGTEGKERGVWSGALDCSSGGDYESGRRCVQLY